jgi:hypothetical protein
MKNSLQDPDFHAQFGVALGSLARAKAIMHRANETNTHELVSHSDAWTESHLTKNEVNHFWFALYFLSPILVSSTFIFLYSIPSLFSF